MPNNQRTERSTTAGLYPEHGKPGSQLKDQLTPTLAHELRNPPKNEEAPVPGVFAAMVPLAALGGRWFRPVEGGDWQALLATAVVALITLLGIVWLSRARSTRRWKAVLDAYAAREIARNRRKIAPPLEPRTT